LRERKMALVKERVTRNISLIRSNNRFIGSFLSAPYLVIFCGASC